MYGSRSRSTHRHGNIARKHENKIPDKVRDTIIVLGTVPPVNLEPDRWGRVFFVGSIFDWRRVRQHHRDTMQYLVCSTSSSSRCIVSCVLYVCTLCYPYYFVHLTCRHALNTEHTSIHHEILQSVGNMLPTQHSCEDTCAMSLTPPPSKVPKHDNLI